ncbi:hypothetical protein Cylst_5292 [Cylindrospermum stagnale PCC 7417]|uniref:DUF4258 domain-containing protein n=1 Tax=Cylindrospermum stagnale PCC 7417 TaxID=56107 RepID=K9X5H2_9NOST|nr:DUF4258 domain-containing protein [Cylindrospermum stagnale]AFZ27321.1 hypothetical protein Cylst_5292 [Cylindrospermum stagnale PCC 7417]
MGNRKQQIHKLISAAINTRTFNFTAHAVTQSQHRCLVSEDIFYSVLKGSVLEEQQDLNRAPKFIVSGRTEFGMRLETVWAYNERNGWATLISLFSPDTNPWNKSHIRRR